MQIKIREKNGENQLIAVNEIKKLLESNDSKLSLSFESGNVDDAYRKLLQEHLPQHHVFNTRSRNEIWITPAMGTDKILVHKQKIYQAAKSFREEATQLINTLIDTYQIDTSDTLSFRKIIKNGRKGKVDKSWTYWFHGAECRFENQTTGQAVEVIITNGTEWGALDSYFFLKYINTTPRFKELATFFSNDLSSLTKALNLLEDLGLLYRIDEFSQRGIIAK